MGVFDHLYVDSLEALRLPGHILSKFEDLGYGKDKLLSVISNPIQVYFDRFFADFKLDGQGNIWENGELATDVNEESTPITLYDKGGDIDFELNSYVKIVEGKIVGDIFWHHCQIKKDGVTYKWVYDDDEPEDKEFYDPANYTPDPNISNPIGKAFTSPEGRRIMAKALLDPLRRPMGYKDLVDRMIKRGI